MEVIIAPCDALAVYSKLWKAIALLLTLFEVRIIMTIL